MLKKGLFLIMKMNKRLLIELVSTILADASTKIINESTKNVISVTLKKTPTEYAN